MNLFVMSMFSYCFISWLVGLEGRVFVSYHVDCSFGNNIMHTVTGRNEREREEKADWGKLLIYRKKHT